jgi:hypothetical protein
MKFGGKTFTTHNGAYWSIFSLRFYPSAFMQVLCGIERFLPQITNNNTVENFTAREKYIPYKQDYTERAGDLLSKCNIQKNGFNT